VSIVDVDIVEKFVPSRKKAVKSVTWFSPQQSHPAENIGRGKINQDLGKDGLRNATAINPHAIDTSRS
jgi:hypothetical protein